MPLPIIGYKVGTVLWLPQPIIRYKVWIGFCLWQLIIGYIVWIGMMLPIIWFGNVGLFLVFHCLFQRLHSLLQYYLFFFCFLEFVFYVCVLLVLLQFPLGSFGLFQFLLKVLHLQLIFFPQRALLVQSLILRSVNSQWACCSYSCILQLPLLYLFLLWGVAHGAVQSPAAVSYIGFQFSFSLQLFSALESLWFVLKPSHSAPQQC